MHALHAVLVRHSVLLELSAWETASSKSTLPSVLIADLAQVHALPVPFLRANRDVNFPPGEAGDRYENLWISGNTRRGVSHAGFSLSAPRGALHLICQETKKLRPPKKSHLVITGQKLIGDFFLSFLDLSLNP